MCTSYFIEPVQWMEQAMIGAMDGQVTVSYIFLYYGQNVSDRTDSDFNSITHLVLFPPLGLAVVSQM